LKRTAWRRLGKDCTRINFRALRPTGWRTEADENPRLDRSRTAAGIFTPDLNASALHWKCGIDAHLRPDDRQASAAGLERKQDRRLQAVWADCLRPCGSMSISPVTATLETNREVGLSIRHAVPAIDIRFVLELHRPPI
jgi:hypothetical protein